MTPQNWWRNVGKSFHIAYPQVRWFGLGVVATFVLAPVLWFFGFPAIPDEPAPLYYLLGAQAETLGTILVLAFTGSLVAAQIAARYNRILFHRILGAWALWYACPFGVGITMPLFLLHGDFFLWSVRISLLIAVYCLVSLVPFAVAIRGLLSISEAIRETKDNILADGSPGGRSRRIKELGNIAIGALKLGDYEVFEEGVGELVSAAKASDDKPELSPMISDELLGMLLRNVADRFACQALLGGVVELGMKDVNHDDVVATGRMMDKVVAAYRAVDIATIRSHGGGVMLVRECANTAAARLQPTILQKCQTVLYTMGERAISELPGDAESGRQAVSMLGDIAQMALNSRLSPRDSEVTANLAIAQIEDLAKKSESTRRTEVVKAATLQLLRLTMNNTANGLQIRGTAKTSLSVLQNIVGGVPSEGS